MIMVVMGREVRDGATSTSWVPLMDTMVETT